MRKVFSVAIILIVAASTNAQSVGIGTNSPKSSAQLDVSSNNKGMLIPRMSSTERKAISNPEFGLLVFDTELATVMFFDGLQWKGLAFNSEDKVALQMRTSPGSSPGALFGSRTAISGNYAIVGAHLHSSGALTSMGEAYIYSKTASGWQLQARLVAQDSAAAAYFGGSVAIAGDYAVVGSPGKNNGAGPNQGKIYIFRRTGTAWIQEATFIRPSNPPGDSFGWSVGISTSSAGVPIITVGIPYGDGSSADRGEVYVYTRNQSTNLWSFSQNIVAPDLFAGDLFGSTISMDGDYLAIGAPNQDNTPLGRTNAGSAYIYVFGGGVFTLQQKLAGTLANSLFGFSLSISGDQLVIGAPFASFFANTSGDVYAYKRNGVNWNSQTTISIFDYEGGLPAALFGASLSLNGNNLLIGAPGGFEYPNGARSSSPNLNGIVFSYKLMNGGTTVVQTQTYKAEIPAPSDLFGNSVGLFNTSLIIGGPRIVSNNATQFGAVLFGVVSQ